MTNESKIIGARGFLAITYRPIPQAPLPSNHQQQQQQQQYSDPFDEEPLPVHKNSCSPEPSGRTSSAYSSTERTLAQLASDSLDEFYQDEQVKENMSTANVGYRGFTTFGGNLTGSVNPNSTGGNNASVSSPSGSDALTSEVRERGDVKVRAKTSAATRSTIVSFK